MIGHGIEQVTPEEMQRRYTALLAESPCAPDVADAQAVCGPE